MRTRVLRIVVFALLLLECSVELASADPVRFRVVPLGLAGDATGINESGAVTVTADVQGDAFLVNGRDIVPIPGGAVAAAVNDKGTVTGFDVGTRPYVWNGGDLRFLSPPVQGFALDINNSDVVAGQVEGEPTIWRDGNPQRIFGGGPFGSANSINDKGTVVGGIDTALCCFGEAFIWREGQGAQLLGENTNALGVNEHDVVVGQAFSSSGHEIGFFLDPEFGLSNFELPQGAIDLTPFAISDANWVVGKAFVPGDDEEQIPRPRGFVSFGFGPVLYLDDLVQTGWTIFSANDINNKGQIAATAFDPRSRTTVAVRLDPVEPVPEPTTLLLLGFGAAALGRRAWVFGSDRN